jgi:type III restriction enzyme
MEEVFGEDGPLLYLIRETKSTTEPDGLRGTENLKIHCGERHFVGALGVNYRVITSADDLP